MSIETLTERDEISVYAQTHSQDDMANWMEASSAVTKTLKCRMQPVGGDKKIQHDIPMETEAYTALFSTDPEISLHHKVVYNGKVYSVVSTGNRSGQDWLWEVLLVHDPSLGLDS